MDKKRFDSFMALAEFARQTREARRKTEWQLSFTLWALLVGAAVTFRDRPPANIYILIASGILIAAFHFWWVAWNGYRANTEACFMYDFARSAEEELSIEAPHFERRERPSILGFLSHPPGLLQWLIAVMLTAGAIAIIGLSSKTTLVFGSS
jgi:hypothetical protein